MLLGENKKSENCMLNKVTWESATDIFQKFWDIKSYGTVPKDEVTQSTITYSKLTTETLEQGVKYV